MWLPMKYTLTRQASYAALARGRYHNIRLFNYGFGLGFIIWGLQNRVPPPEK